MKTAVGVVGVLIFLLSSSLEGVAADLIGTTIPPLPDGIFEDGGVCIGRTQQTECERNIGILKTSAGKDFLIYTGSAASLRGEKPRWRVTDTAAFPIVPNGAEFVWGDCRISGTPDASIVAIVKSSPKGEWLRARDWAYRVDYDTGKFVPLEPKNVDCANSALEGD